MASALPPRHLVFSTSKEALWSYERHLKEKKGDVPVELFLFSEQEDLNVNVLADKLNGSSSSAQVSVLLMLTGSSSYLWLDREHHPKNVDLCTMLKQFPRRLNFVICPTSRATRAEWEAQSSQAPGIFGDFWDNNVSVWDGFDRDVASTSQTCSLICTESKGKKDVGEKPSARNRFSLGLPLALGICAIELFYIANLHMTLKADRGQFHEQLEKLQGKLDATYAEKERLEESLKTTRTEKEKFQNNLKTAQTESEKLQKDLEATKAEKEKSQSDLKTAQAESEKLQKDLEATKAEKEKSQSDLKTAQAENEKLQKDLEATNAEKEKSQSDLKTAQAENEKLQKDLEATKAEKEKSQNDLKTAQAENNQFRTNLEAIRKEKDTIENNLKTLQAENKKLQEDAVALAGISRL